MMMFLLLYIILLALANGSGGADADADTGDGGVAPQEGDRYRGGYFCSQGFTNADVFVGSQLPNTTSAVWRIIFQFAVPSPSNCTGSYNGTVARTPSSLPPLFVMEGDAWIDNPCGYVFLPPFSFSIDTGGPPQCGSLRRSPNFTAARSLR
jgi:hypothetical protein